MNNETIKQFTPITVEEAGEMLRENGWKPVEGLAFGNHRVSSDLVGISIQGNLHFESSQGFYSKCAKVTELDPCKAPDGCPELEPWMAYVGIGDQLKEWEDFKFLLNCGCHWGTCCSHSAPAFPDGQHQWAIDVRTEWAQEHFPEHCRIRNYQEPDAFEEFCEAWALDSLQYASPKWFKGMMKQAYELGQANPTK